MVLRKARSVLASIESLILWKAEYYKGAIVCIVPVDFKC